MKINGLNLVIIYGILYTRVFSLYILANKTEEYIYRHINRYIYIYKDIDIEEYIEESEIDKRRENRGEGILLGNKRLSFYYE